MNKKAYVYFLINDIDNIVKIGRTKDLYIRINNLFNNGSLINIEKSFYLEVESEEKANDIERFFHKTFKLFHTPLDKKIDGYNEWFDLKIIQSNYFNLCLEICERTSHLQRNYKKNNFKKLIHKFNFKLEKKKKQNINKKNKISEKYLLIPAIIFFKTNFKNFTLKKELSIFIKNLLILTKEEKLTPLDRNTNFIEIRIDNIISHKTLEKYKISNILKIKNKAFISKGKKVNKIYNELPDILKILSVLAQEDFIEIKDLKKILKIKNIEVPLMRNLSLFNYEKIEKKVFLSISKEGKIYLNSILREGKFNYLLDL